MIRAGLVGVTGYTGMELARLLVGHPEFELTVATSRGEAGKTLAEIYPFMQNLPSGDLVLSEPDPKLIAKNCDVAFLAVPHTAATQMAAALLELNIKVVDLSADFRLKDAATYEAWYKVKHERPDLLPQAVYGLPELYAQKISQAKLVANPGCYPSTAILGLYAALKHDLIEQDRIIIDSKSGTSGAGRNAVVSSLYCEVADSFKAYGLTKHRHTPEIEQELSNIAKAPIEVSFNPHLVPMHRGILSTIYAKLKAPADQIYQCYLDTWAKHPFVRVLPEGKLPETKHVRGSMFCDISPIVDKRLNQLIVVVAIDNLCRGASGQAIANANLMFNLPVTTGLFNCPLV